MKKKEPITVSKINGRKLNTSQNTLNEAHTEPKTKHEKNPGEQQIELLHCTKLLEMSIKWILN